MRATLVCPRFVPTYWSTNRLCAWRARDVSSLRSASSPWPLSCRRTGGHARRPQHRVPERPGPPGAPTWSCSRACTCRASPSTRSCGGAASSECPPWSAGPTRRASPTSWRRTPTTCFWVEAENGWPGSARRSRPAARPRSPAGEAPELTKSPAPRYDLLRPGFYYHMSLQVSRGCPFLCEFLRHPRPPRPQSAYQNPAGPERAATRSPPPASGHGFFVEDNFMARRSRCATCCLVWRSGRTTTAFQLFYEASLNLARTAPHGGHDRRGIPNGLRRSQERIPEALKETKRTRTSPRHADPRPHHSWPRLKVLGGFIVGFDSDGPDIFDRQVEFIQKAGVPTAMFGVLQALPNTPLETRMRAEGRLQDMPRPQDQFGRANFKTVLPAPVAPGWLPACARSSLRAEGLLRARRRDAAPPPPPARNPEERSHHPLVGPAGHRGPRPSGALSPRLLAVPAGHLAVGQARLVDAMRHAVPGHHFLCSPDGWCGRGSRPRCGSRLPRPPAAVPMSPGNAAAVGAS